MFHALGGLEQQMGGAIAPYCLELDPDASVGAEAHTILDDGRAKEITAELFEARAIVRRHPDVGVDVEAVALGLARAAGGDVPEVRLIAEAPDAGAGARAEGDTALDGGAGEAGQDG